MELKLELARLINTHLQIKGWKKTDFVGRMGYLNVSKGLRRLDSWLQGEDLPREDQVNRLSVALGLDPQAVLKAIAKDREAILAEAAAKRGKDPRTYLIIRLFAGCYVEKALGENLDESKALGMARSEARRMGRRCCLNCSSGRNIWLDKNGDIEAITRGSGPAMRINGAPSRLKVGERLTTRGR